MSKTNKVLDDFTEKLLKDYGPNSIVTGEALQDRELKVIPVSPILDIALGGGVPEGSCVVLVSQPKVGKTVTALTIAANAQKPEYGNKDVVYANIEMRLKKRDLEGIDGLNYKNKFSIIESGEGNILSAEQYLDICEQYLLEKPNIVLILDSVSALLTEKEKTSKMGEMQRADGAKLLAKFCRKMAAPIAVNKSIVICITHLIANPSGYGSPYQESGGQKIAYQADIKLRGKSMDRWEVGGVQIGQIIKWQIQCSALGPPGAEVSSYLRYGKGLDAVYETMTLAIEAGVAKAAGAWVTYKDHKLNGREKFYSFLVDNPDIYKELHDELMRIFQRS